MDQARIDMFKEVLKMDANDPMVHFGLGQEYLRGGHYPEAIEAFENAIRLNAGYSAAYRFMGECLEKSGQGPKAAEIYAKGIPIAEKQGDLEAAKAMRAFLKRLEK